VINKVDRENIRTTPVINGGADYFL